MEVPGAAAAGAPHLLPAWLLPEERKLLRLQPGGVGWGPRRRGPCLAPGPGWLWQTPWLLVGSAGLVTSP